MVAYQAPPSMGFSRQEYWSGLPFPSPADLPNPGIEPRSPALQTLYHLSHLIQKQALLLLPTLTRLRNKGRGEILVPRESRFVNVLFREQLLLLTAQRGWPMSQEPTGPGSSGFISSSQSEGVVRRRRKDSNSTEIQQV